MLGSSAGTHSPRLPASVRRALEWPRLAAAALTALLLSLGPLAGPGLLGFLTPTELALAWAEHLAELSVLAAGLLVTYTLLDELLPAPLSLRLPILCVLLFMAACGLAVLLHAYYARGFQHLPPPLRLLSDAFHWGLPAVLLAVTADLHRRALQAESDAHGVELARAQQQQGEAEQELALLQAQIEPHFLFNILGNVRRLYRTQPDAGAGAIDSLMRYLRTAIPRLRNPGGRLRDELELVRAYLELHRIRMGPRLAFSVQADAGLLDVAFPSMLAMTLVENAICHGIAPAGGGEVTVRATRSGDLLELTVSDDGVGFGAAPSGGTGVGLANVRRQLAARYAGRARLTLTAGEPRGARARLVLPLAAVAAV